MKSPRISGEKSSKILVIAEVFHPEEFLINELVAQWKEQGRQVEVLARVPSYPYGKVYPGYRNKLYTVDDYRGIRVHRVGFVSGYRSSVVRKILNYLLFVILGTFVVIKLGRRFDRYFIYHTGPLTVAMPGILGKKFFKTRVAIWTQDLWPEAVYHWGFGKHFLTETFLNGLVSFVYRNCSNILVTSELYIPRIQRFVKKTANTHFTVAHNWPALNILERSRNPVQEAGPRTGINFTFAGNISMAQNLPNIISGFAAIRNDFPDAVLNIYGDGSSMESVVEHTRSLQADRVIFHGRKPQNEMPEILQAADVLIISLFECENLDITIPAKFSAYLTTGKPIMGIISGIVRKLIEEHTLGLCCHPGKIDEIAEGFRTFCRLIPEEYTAFGVNAKALLEHDFSRERIMNTITNILYED